MKTVLVIKNKLMPRLKSKGFIFYASPLNPKKSFYFRKRNFPLVRLSDHKLQPKQEKENVIYIIINKQEMSINGRELPVPDKIKTSKLCTMIIEEVYKIAESIKYLDN